MWGYYVAGGFLIFVALVLSFFGGMGALRAANSPRPRPPVHPDDWHPTAPLWDETEQEQSS